MESVFENCHQHTTPTTDNAELLLTHTAKHVGEHEEQRWLPNLVVKY